MEFEIVAEGLLYPDGPIAMADGSVILVEVARGALTRVWDGKTEVIAQLGGGPNGAALGPDGAIYVCNNGGYEWGEIEGMLAPQGPAAEYESGRIERVDLESGAWEQIYAAAEGEPLSGPSDLVFDRAGGFWFTDYGKSYPRCRDHSGLYYATPDGSSIAEVVYPMSTLCGVALAPDETALYCAETLTGRLWAFDLEAPGRIAPRDALLPGRCVATLPGLHYLGGLAVEEGGQVCATTSFEGGVRTFTVASGASEHHALPHRLVSNICFAGPDRRDAYITLSGAGQLIKTRWPRPGLKLNFAG